MIVPERAPLSASAWARVCSVANWASRSMVRIRSAPGALRADDRVERAERLLVLHVLAGQLGLEIRLDAVVAQAVIGDEAEVVGRQRALRVAPALDRADLHAAQGERLDRLADRQARARRASAT
jgi:hypothetical protein